MIGPGTGVRVYPIAMALIVAGFILETVAEVILLRRVDLAVVYATIMVVEALMTAAAMLGEIVDLRRMMGAGCVVVGIAPCSS